MALGSFRPVSGRLTTVILPAGEALNEGEAVKLSSNVVTKAGDGETVAGVTAATVASGANVGVYIDGVFEGTAASGVNFAVGDVVYMAASQELDAGAMNNLSAGVVVNADPSTAGKVQFVLTPSVFIGVTTHA